MAQKIDFDLVMKILDENKSVKAVRSVLLDYVKKQQERTDGKKDNEWFCRLHNKLEPYENMVLDYNGNSKGVCKAAQWRWQKYYRHLTRLKRDANTNIDEIKYLERKLNSVDSYDYDKDWSEYLATKK